MLLEHFVIGKSAHSFLGHLDLKIEGGLVVDYHHLIEVEADITPDPAVDDYGHTWSPTAPFTQNSEAPLLRCKKALDIFVVIGRM